ncbi:selenoneine biosynthesis selenosugar synthase SenB [Actinokineospora sp.]|uniref:selenoneine biosynthesis selenosugar synthase SenB n=1 Tax=Actinokineospora sp. TaxID=1872133 RepID=UPI0040379BB5
MILIVSPAPPQALLGNGVTTRRWAEILTGLGHEVTTDSAYRGGAHTALVALHARKSADSVLRFRAEHPRAPIVLALTGTDLYPSLAANDVDPAVLAAADRLIVLQHKGLDQLDGPLRARARVVVQSVPDIAPEPAMDDRFEVCVLAHLRPVKDPLRAAAAARLLPTDSRLRVTHAGAGLDAELTTLARAESSDNPRYTWIGPVPRKQALYLLARSKILVLSSHHEGGANVVSEALAAGVPVVCSAIPGSTGLLGDRHPGYYPAGDTAALAELLSAAETNRGGYYDDLRRHCAELRHLVSPSHEIDSWAGLLDEMSVTST